MKKNFEKSSQKIWREEKEYLPLHPLLRGESLPEGQEEEDWLSFLAVKSRLEAD